MESTGGGRRSGSTLHLRATRRYRLGRERFHGLRTERCPAKVANTDDLHATPFREDGQSCATAMRIEPAIVARLRYARANRGTRTANIRSRPVSAQVGLRPKDCPNRLHLKRQVTQNSASSSTQTTSVAKARNDRQTLGPDPLWIERYRPWRPKLVRSGADGEHPTSGARERLLDARDRGRSHRNPSNIRHLGSFFREAYQREILAAM